MSNLLNKIKLNVLLAITDQLASSFKEGIKEYVRFFKTHQGAFKGEKKTYQPRPDKIDVPNMRANNIVVTTVKEKLDWLEETQTDYINALFSQEATNASGIAKAKLIVDGIDFGELSSLELLRLKSLIENGDFKEMYANLPVRSDSEIWEETKNEQYLGRAIYDSPITGGINKTTTKESYILEDPNASKAGVNYKPQVATKDTIEELGDYTYQKFSGETSHRERAEILRRIGRLQVAVVEALKVANDVEAVNSVLTSNKLFGYIHNGK